MPSYPAKYPHWARQGADHAQTTVPSFMDINSSDFDAEWLSRLNPLPSTVHVNLYGNTGTRILVKDYLTLARLLQEGSTIVS